MTVSRMTFIKTKLCKILLNRMTKMKLIRKALNRIPFWVMKMKRKYIKQIYILQNQTQYQETVQNDAHTLELN